MSRVAIGRISHETNTFSPIPTTLESFVEGRSGVVDGSTVLSHFHGTKTGLGGFLEVGDAEHWEMIGTVAADATPSANVAASAHERLKNTLIERLRAGLPVDGVLLHLHGAMLAESAQDAEGDICRSVRQLIGPHVPLIVELDLHGNITAEFCSVVDAVFAYNTNPHIDAYERGLEAAHCLARILKGEMPRPSVHISKPPMLPPTINMRTAEGPMHDLLDRGQEWEASPTIVDVSVFGGFPYADFPEAGTSIVVTSLDVETGERCAREMGRYAWSIRHNFLKRIPNVEDAVSQAIELIATAPQKPVVLADVADNPGGGGSGDTTGLLHELVRRQVSGAAASIWDPETVQQAIDVGVGNEGSFSIGGKAAPGAYGTPLEVHGHVAAISDGRFVGWGPVVRGQSVTCGPTVRIDVGGLKLVVTTTRHAANDRGYFQVAGVQPGREPMLVIKSRGHFRADFEPIAHSIIEVDAPGAANPDLRRFTYQHVRRPIWPLDRDMEWNG